MQRSFHRGSFVGGLAALGPALGSTRSSAAAAEPYTLRCNIPTPPGTLLARLASMYGEAVARRSNGQLAIEVYTSGELAKEQASIDALVNGVIDLTIQGPDFLQSLVPHFAVFDLPFLFDTFPKIFRLLDGPIAADLVSELQAKGLVGYAWGCNGFIDMETTSKSIVGLGDMKGLRIRTRPSPFSIATYQAMGALPVSIDLAELFTALQQKTVDGTDVTVGTATELKLYTVCRHVAMSNHIAACAIMMGSKRKIDTLPPDLQQILRTEAIPVGRAWRSMTIQHVNESMQALRQNGVTFTEVQSRDFRRAMDPVYAMFETKFGSPLMSRLLATAGG